MVLMQEDLNKDSLVRSVGELFANADSLHKALEAAPSINGTQRILELIEEVQK